MCVLCACVCVCVECVGVNMCMMMFMRAGLFLFGWWSMVGLAQGCYDDACFPKFLQSNSVMQRANAMTGKWTVREYD